MKHRVWILTDISSLEAGVREPDDGQSLIRLLFYADVLQIEGLAATSNLGHGQRCRPELILEALDAYESDFSRLQKHGDFPAPDVLREKVTQGTPHALPDLPVETSLKEPSPASEKLIRAVDASEAPLWVCVWGGTADLALALHKIRESRSQTEVSAFVSRLRVHASYDQDSTASWIKREFPDLFYITRQHGIRGMYRGGDTSLCNRNWVQTHVKPCGALGALYPDYEGGDPWSWNLGAVRGLKEGDTPTFLNLLGQNPLCGWGGTFIETAPHRWEDAPASDANAQDFDPRIAGVYRHRAAFQNDFAARLNWLR